MSNQPISSTQQKKHLKHTKLTRPNYGHFARNEWAIVGTPCDVIRQLAFRLIADLSKQYQASYVDADHKGADADDLLREENALAYGANLEYTDKITHHRFETKAAYNSFQYHTCFNEQDVVFVNGNHFKANKQIVVIDPKKEKSLQKKLDWLTDVGLILTTQEATSLPRFLTEGLDNINSIPVYKIEDTDKILSFLQADLQKSVAPLNGLVLAGGKSQRMGEDKGLINYHGKAQREYIADIVATLCDNTFLSFRQGQSVNVTTSYPILEDTFLGLGPFGAIASAFLKQPNHAWLVVACDLPLLDKSTLAYLLQHRNPSNIATAFKSPDNEFPEPLVAIWEPKSYSVLLQFLAQGYSCPRKVLINSAVQLLTVPKGEKLMNVNSPEELMQAQQMIDK